ncbi:MAG: hypothetical protein KDA59_17435 [Planctomycetales bacterium]|nr:hypothetical protein [Planctomycetales bacterium]
MLDSDNQRGGYIPKKSRNGTRNVQAAQYFSSATAKRAFPKAREAAFPRFSHAASGFLT